MTRKHTKNDASLLEAEYLLAELIEGVELTDEWSSSLKEDELGEELDGNKDKEFDVRASLLAEDMAEWDERLLPLK